MSEWANHPLDELVDISSGGTPSRTDTSFWGGDIPWVTPSDITASETKYIFDTADTITEKGLASSSAKLLPRGALLLTSRATIGEVRIAARPLATNQGFKNLVAKSSADSLFLFYQLSRLKGNFERYSAGSTFLEINRKDTGRVSVLLPREKEEQKKIARILQVMDRAIEHTEELVGKYQQIKAGLMHDLFTRGLGSDGQLRPPREMEPELYHKTKIGWVPKDWMVKPLNRGLSTSPKNGFSPKEVSGWQGLYVLGLSCLTRSGFKPLQLKYAPNGASSSGALLNEGDFLISRSNTSDLVGLCGIYQSVGSPAIYPDLMIRLRLNADLNPRFLERYLLSPLGRKRISAIAVGTSGSMVKINGREIKRFPVLFPPVEEQRDINATLEPVENQVAALEGQLNKLKKQKSGLMYDLLTGKVPVPVETEVELEAAHV